MIIVRSPLRISLGGGGTDLPSYSRQFGGFLVAAAIDKYVYLTLHQTFVPDLIVKYSRLERVATVDEIEHPIVREAMRLVGVEAPSLEITSMADIPAGTGLGSSGSFTTALLKVLHAHKKDLVHPQELASEACTIEIDRLGEPVGKQDQYIAAYGGITAFDFSPDDQVMARPAKLSAETLYNLEDNLLLFFTGYTRTASSILRDQDERSRSGEGEMLDNLHLIKELGRETLDALESGDLRRFAELMNVHWEQKRRRSEGMTNGQIDEWLALARSSGAIGAKLVGAGGGGFLLLYAEDKVTLRHALNAKGLTEVRFRFDFEGTRVVSQ